MKQHGLCRFSVVSSVFLAVCSGTFPVPAGDWPQIRGPRRSNVSDEELSYRWKGSVPPLRWKAFVGTGYSSIVVRDGRVVTLGFQDGKRRGGGTDTVWCFDLDRGSVLWKHSYRCPKWNTQHAGGPAATPVFGERHVYTLSKEGHVFALKAENGDVVWTRNIRREFNVRRRPSKPRKDYGYTGSPALVDDLLVLQVGGRNANTVALKAATGETVWRSGNADGEGGAGYATPMPFVWKDRSLLAVFTLKALEVLEAKTGRRLDRYEWVTDFGLNVSDPCIDGDRILITSSYGKGAALLQLDGERLRELHRERRLRCKFVTPAVWENHAYASSDGGILKCVDMKSGRIRYKQRSVGNASILVAGGKLLILGERGELVVAEASPKRYRELRRAKIHRGQCWTAPALADGRLLVRNTPGGLLCYDLREKKR